MDRPGARPVFLNLLRIRMPVTAVLSILHRASGVLMVLATPVLIYLFGLSLHDPQGYVRAQAVLANPLAKAAGLLLIWALSHHLLAGIRFLLIDVDLGVGIGPARRSAWWVNVAALSITLLFLGALIL